MKTSIIFRSHNDMPLVKETLAMLARQRAPFELIALDNESSDGTADAVAKMADQFVNIPKGTYVPGRVLNRGMTLSRSDLVVFLNSDCSPEDEFWLERLLSGFTDDSVAAVFGRQKPRPDCPLLQSKDTDDTFGDGVKQQRWRHCFSMASSAIRRSVWESMPFSETLKYSEDIDWTWRARKAGHTIRYVAGSAAFHSHRYTLKQLYKRQLGEGRAEAAIFEWPAWDRTLLRYSILPLARQVAADWKYCLPRGAVADAVMSPVMRATQAWGRRAGFREGMRERGTSR